MTIQRRNRITTARKYSLLAVAATFVHNTKSVEILRHSIDLNIKQRRRLQRDAVFVLFLQAHRREGV
jgi:hypothetical protein